jgi:Na+-driven multidrug efflux pump
MIPGVWAMGQFDSTKKFLSSQYKTKIPVLVQLFTTILHFFWCRHFITNLGMRETGAAIATNITYILNMVISDLWIRYLQNTEFKDMIFWYDRTCY